MVVAFPDPKVTARLELFVTIHIWKGFPHGAVLFFDDACFYAGDFTEGLPCLFGEARFLLRFMPNRKTQEHLPGRRHGS